MKYLYLIVIATIFTACSHTTPNDYSAEFETAWFSYPNDDLSSRTDLCEVKYYVNGDTLFTSEKYFFVSLSYCDNDDVSKHYTQFVYFDKAQKPDERGWYHIIFNRNDIWREPNSHLTSIVLRSYMGDKYSYDKPGTPHADAYLYNITDYIHHGQDRKELTPQLKKLLPAIK